MQILDLFKNLEQLNRAIASEGLPTKKNLQTTASRYVQLTFDVNGQEIHAKVSVGNVVKKMKALIDEELLFDRFSSGEMQAVKELFGKIKYLNNAQTQELKLLIRQRFGTSIHEVSSQSSLIELDPWESRLGAHTIKWVISDKQKALEIVSKNGLELANCTNRLKRDKDVIKAAVANDPKSIQFKRN